MTNFKTSCPGRISLSKHCDYLNNDLLYILDERKIELEAEFDFSKSNEKKIFILNQNNSFKNFEFYVADIFKEKFLDDYKNEWVFYVVYCLKIFLDFHKIKEKNFSMKLIFKSNLPARGGLSSSHALLNVCIEVFSYGFNIKSWIDIFESLKKNKLDRNLLKNLTSIIKLSQKIEIAKGFNSGLGDQSAQLLGKKNYFSFIKLFPNLKVEYVKKPENLSIISIPSYIEADKSDPEFSAANENIKLYKEVSKSFLENFDGSKVKYLGDLLYEYDDKEIIERLMTIKDKRKQGLALYGLAEGARLKFLKEKYSQNNSPDKDFCFDLGKHINLSHEAERRYKFYSLDHWEKLEDEKFDFEVNPLKALAEHIGIYRASTFENDRLQYLANQINGVYGSSISGAGLGGNNIVLFNKFMTEQVLQVFHNQESR